MKLPAFSKTYEGRTVLDFEGLDIEKGRIYAVIGANGSGKSTFAKILADVLPADKRSKLPEGVSVGYMPQKNYAFRMSTKKNILLGGNDTEKAEKLMDGLCIRELEKKRADKLSGGETARMALARLMMRSFDLVILDEPTAAMDMESTLVSEKLIRSYAQESGCALILITHSLMQARRLSDVLLFFHKGRLIEYGDTERLVSSPEKEETRQFLTYFF